ncbi:MAG: aminomethyl transferase family protein, partial [Akkermansiaceae bacterium]|nr:aminomethyl transferase family protein [Akkermansiaceae bacterium]NIW77630.1 aminomethyl transferase family protein [Gemmatimonadota bacterium]
DISDSVGMVTVVGPESGATLEGVVADAEPGGFVLAGGGPLDGGYLAMAGPEGLSVIAAPDMLAELWTALEARGAVPAGWGVWDTLRVEAGRPAFGRDMDDRTIPIEAGLEDAIDHAKGCYTGQEVIVRIRDRGHVNWHLRRLELGESTPNPGDELFEEGGEKALGRVTSSVQSPGFGQVVGLGYVRR